MSTTNQITGFYVKCNTRLKWANQRKYSIQLLRNSLKCNRTLPTTVNISLGPGYTSLHIHVS